MKGFGKILIGVLIVAIVLGSFGYLTVTGWYKSAIYDKNHYETEQIEFEVSEGESYTSVVNRLEEAKIIKSAVAARLYLKFNNITPKIKFGKYKIASGKDFPEIVAILEKGVFKPGVNVTFPEGTTDETIGKTLESTLGADSKFNLAEFNQIVTYPEQFTFSQEVTAMLSTYKPEGKPLEGFLYPDTYEFDLDQTTLQIVDKMLQNFRDKVVLEIDLGADFSNSSIKNLYDAMTLASIVEKEARGVDDMPDVAEVFHNRLEIDMALQSDATIFFATGKDETTVTYADLEIDSPYNTYKNPGLPPTPINNPRVEAISSSLFPKDNPYFFFFYTPDGRTFYSETFEEHSVQVCEELGC